MHIPVASKRCSRTSASADKKLHLHIHMCRQKRPRHSIFLCTFRDMSGEDEPELSCCLSQVSPSSLNQVAVLLDKSTSFSVRELL